MDPQNTTPSSQSSLTVPEKKTSVLVKITLVFLLFLISLSIGLFGYLLGQGVQKSQVKPSPAKVSNIKKKIPATQPTVAPTVAIQQGQSYTVIYTPPSGWQTMLWHPTPDSTENAILSPDYTSIADPNPQTGLVILIYQFPGQFSDMKQFRGSVEETEENMQGITQTEVGGFPAWHAIFISSDSIRIVDDYHILKDHDHWLVRFILPGNSLPAAQAEEKKYSYQMKELLQSIQFKTLQYQ